MLELVENVVKTSHYLFNRKLVSGKAGNVSARFKNPDGDVITITPTEISLSQVNTKNIVLLNTDGFSINKNIPSSELPLHLEIYKKRPDVNGIVHTHSPYATGFSFSTQKIKRMEGLGDTDKLYLAEVPYEPPGSKKLAFNVSKMIKNEDVILLKNHGLVVAGKNTEQAALMAEFVEEMAKTQFIAQFLNSMNKD